MSNAEKYLLLARRGQILRRPVYLNIPIVEHCNLNCRGCFHFSPIAEPWCMEPEDLRQDLALLRDVPEVETFLRGLMIYGGEPLLHPALEEIMDLVRGAFPGQGVNCAIMTNGLLLSRMPESFWEKCRTLAVGISLSPYPIGLDYDALRREIEARGVTASLNITSDGDRFIHRQ